MRRFLSDGHRKRLISLCGLFVFGHGTLVRALEIQPSIGVGAEYTDNATLSSSRKKSDTITTTYIGANIKHNVGTLQAQADTSFDTQHYTQGTFGDQSYFNLNTLLDWEMVKHRFHWSIRDIFNQRPVISTNVNTPANLQNSNIFTLGANWLIPFSARSQLILLPEYRKFYYESQNINNRQYALAANWMYRAYRLTSVGLNASYRQVDYAARQIANSRFSTLQLSITGQRSRSKYTLNMGVTNVRRDAGKEISGFSGNLDWLVNMSNRSKLQARLSTQLTDASSGSLSANITANTGSFNNVQITAGVIRNKLFWLGYLRKDGVLNSKVWAEYREVLYSNSPDDRKIGTLGINLNYPMTAFLSSGLYVNYSKDELIEIFRTDKRLVAGLNFTYRHSRKLRSNLDISYRQKVSTVSTQEYTEGSVFYNLVYGFGRVYRPVRSSL